jgi:hypothetical protein
VAGDGTLILIGGKTLIYGQPRFIPLNTRRQLKRHCKSCGSFRKNGSCTINADTFTDPEAEACPAYWNRTYDREARETLASFGEGNACLSNV